MEGEGGRWREMEEEGGGMERRKNQRERSKVEKEAGRGSSILHTCMCASLLQRPSPHLQFGQ